MRDARRRRDAGAPDALGRFAAAPLPRRLFVLAGALGLVKLDPENPYAFALVLIAIGGLLGARLLAQCSLGFARQPGHDGMLLRRSLRHQGLLAAYFVLIGCWERAHPDAVSEFALAAGGLILLLFVTGTLTARAKTCNVQGVSARMLASPFARGARASLRALRRDRDAQPAPPVPLAGALEKGLGIRPPQSGPSIFMIVLLWVVLAVAASNGEAAIDKVTRWINGTDRHGADRYRTPRKGDASGERSALTATTSSGTRTTTTPAAAPSELYADVCGTEVTPGDGAPEPQSTALHDLWLGGHWSAGVGAFIGGCAERAHRLPSGAWYAIGRCRGVVQSVGIAWEEVPPRLLLGQAARFAHTWLADETLLDASPRTAVRQGDLYVVDTVDGSYVLVRSQLTAGKGEPTGGGTCNSSKSTGARYETVVPGLVDSWLTVAHDEWAWPLELARDASGNRRFAFRRPAPDDRVIATATCTSDVACTTSYGGTILIRRSGSRVTADELRAAATPREEAP